MPALVCSAQNCVYNNAMYCGKGDIKVGGENARSSVGNPSTRIDIKCEASNCRYNDDCICHAEHVDIAGAAACDCGETECVTFDNGE